MTSPTVVKMPVGELDTSKRRQILDGARRVFMELGFDGGSMGEIAKAAGVSKGTLYVYFNDKDALFEAIVDEIGSLHEAAIIELDPREDAASALRRFGTAYLEMLCRPQGGSAVRTVMAIAERKPEIGRRYYNSFVSGWISKLKNYLHAQTKAGLLTIDNVDLAAMQFTQCSQASLFLPFVFQAAPPPSRDQMSAVLESAIRMFLTNYQAKTTEADRLCASAFNRSER